MTRALLDSLEAATEARARKDRELDWHDDRLGQALLEVQRLEAVIREIAYERDELVKVEDAAYIEFTEAGGRYDSSGYETRYAEWE